MKKMTAIGSLRVRTIGTGSNKARIVLFPEAVEPHEYFHPRNLQRTVKKPSFRTRVMRSRLDNRYFYVKTTMPRAYHHVLNEARLARFINYLHIPGVRAEEPLAAVLTTKKTRVVYRRIRKKQLTPDHRKNADKLMAALRKLDIWPADKLQFVPGENGVIHVTDFEHWNIPRRTGKTLRLSGGSTYK